MQHDITSRSPSVGTGEVMLEPLDETQSIEEIDARIEEQLSIIVCIDAQMADRSDALHNGDLDRADFLDWSVRASERRGARRDQSCVPATHEAPSYAGRVGLAQ